MGGNHQTFFAWLLFAISQVPCSDALLVSPLILLSRVTFPAIRQHS